MPLMTAQKAADNERLAMRRQAEMERWARKMRPAYYRVLRGVSDAAYKRALKGEEPVDRLMLSKLANDLFMAKRPATWGAAFSGWQAGEISKSIDEPFNGPPQDFGIGIGAEGQGFTLSPVPQRVDGYLKATARREASTKARSINKIVRESMNEVVYAPTGERRGLNPAEIAKRLREGFLQFDKNYANLVARTTCVWSHNEGTMGRYKAAGIDQKEWYATADELACIFCSSLHGLRTPIDAAYLGAGERLEVGDQAMTGADTVTEHPPLHPLCRCTLLPVL